MEVKVDAELVRLLGKSFATQERKVAHEYFLTMAACNTIVPTIIEGARLIDYQGESPDEQALVSAAAAYGYALIERTSGHIVIDILGERQRLDVLGLHEFDSVRKRMSVVVRCPDNTVKVLVKGADSSMLNIMSKTSNNSQVTYTEATENQMHEYASQGLRTLVVGAKNLSDEELEEWQHSYEEASTALIDRAALLREAASLIECNLNLLGATGIEDKLQDGVPEAIESLREAGVKVWVLTGDKQETAISIGLSCKLLTHNMQQIIINGNSKEACENLLAEAKATHGISRIERRKSFSKRQKSVDIAQPEGIQETEGIQAFSESRSHVIRQISDVNDISKGHGMIGAAERHLPLALVIDGTSLVYILESDLEQEARAF